MRRSSAIAACLTSIAALLGGGAMVGGGTASAASYNGVCGSGYTVIDHHDLMGGTTFLTYNNGWNCVVTVRDQPGQAIHMLAGVGIDQFKEDSGNYTTYAGPVYVYAPHTCIEWEGQIQPPPPYQGGNFFEQSGHCN